MWPAALLGFFVATIVTYWVGTWLTTPPGSDAILLAPAHVHHSETAPRAAPAPRRPALGAGPLADQAGARAVPAAPLPAAPGGDSPPAVPDPVRAAPQAGSNAAAGADRRAPEAASPPVEARAAVPAPLPPAAVRAAPAPAPVAPARAAPVPLPQPAPPAVVPPAPAPPPGAPRLPSEPAALAPAVRRPAASALVPPDGQEGSTGSEPVQPPPDAVAEPLAADDSNAKYRAAIAAHNARVDEYNAVVAEMHRRNAWDDTESFRDLHVELERARIAVERARVHAEEAQARLARERSQGRGGT